MQNICDIRALLKITRSIVLWLFKNNLFTILKFKRLVQNRGLSDKRLA